jgi:hypothetical protein
MRWVAQIVLFCLSAISLAMSQTSPDQEQAPLVQSKGSGSEKMDFQSPYLKHAPLAAFSLGSLAIGTVFYALQSSVHDPKVGFVPEDKASLSTAIGAAGFTALIAGVSYFYYSNRDAQRSHVWDAQVSGSLEPEGKLNLSAALVLPLSALKL